MRLRITAHNTGKPRAMSYPDAGGYASVEHLQRELFSRHVRPGVEDRMVQFIPKGVRLIEFTCGNYGYRDYDAGDYLIRAVTEVELVEG